MSVYPKSHPQEEFEAPVYARYSSTRQHHSSIVDQLNLIKANNSKTNISDSKIENNKDSEES